jgi:type II secretory pathway pseudopilin PulG
VKRSRKPALPNTPHTAKQSPNSSHWHEANKPAPCRCTHHSKLITHHSAFSLVELLVVIAVLMILIGILAPAVNQALIRGYLTKGRNAIGALSNAANSYKSDTNYYPGQRYPGLMENVSGTPSANLTGSALLSLSIWGWTKKTDADNDGNKDADEGLYLNSGNIDGDPVSTYMAFKEDAVLSTSSSAGSSKYYVLSDQYPPGKMPILYYPSRVGNSGDTVANAFYNTCNNSLLSSNSTVSGGPGGTTLPTSIGTSNGFDLENSGTNLVYKYDSFLLIAAGLDRTFFTSDDITNFK